MSHNAALCGLYAMGDVAEVTRRQVTRHGRLDDVDDDGSILSKCVDLFEVRLEVLRKLLTVTWSLAERDNRQSGRGASSLDERLQLAQVRRSAIFCRKTALNSFFLFPK